MSELNSSVVNLPDDVWLLIFAYLLPTTHVERNIPYYLFYDQLKRPDADYSSDLRNCIQIGLVNKRLHALITPYLYKRIAITGYGNDHEPSRKITALVDAQHLVEHWIREIHIMVEIKIDLDMVYSLFFLPNIRTITLRNWCDCEPMEFEDDEHLKTSPVTTLNLLDCGAWGACLSQVLSWPACLSRFTIDVEQAEWDGENDGSDDDDDNDDNDNNGTTRMWSNRRLIRGLNPISDDVEDLLIMRDRPNHEGIGCEGPMANLRHFTNLRSLKINQAFILEPYSEHDDLHERLPASLEELEIYFDDYGHFDFMPEGRSETMVDFLITLVRHKESHVPNLKRVRIISEEYDPDHDVSNDYYDESEDDDENENNGDETKSDNNNNRTKGLPWMDEVSYVGTADWTPPQHFVQAFKEAQVSFSVWLGCSRRFRWKAPADEKGFEWQWEDRFNARR